MEQDYVVLVTELKRILPEWPADASLSSKESLLQGLEYLRDSVYDAFKQTYSRWFKFGASPPASFLLIRYQPYAPKALATVDDIRALHTLYLCLALSICRMASPSSKDWCVLTCLIQHGLPRVLPWLATGRPDYEALSMTIIEDLFPGVAWFETLFQTVKAHIGDIYNAFAEWTRADDPSNTAFRCYPSTVYSTQGLSINLNVPETWTCDRSDALCSHLFSTFLAYPAAQPILREWVTKVAPGSDDASGWMLMIYAAKANLDIDIRVYAAYNWIRGLWTRALCLASDRVSGEIQAACRVHLTSGSNHKDIVFCSWADASGVADALRSSLSDNKTDLSEELRGAVNMVHSVFDFQSKAPVYGFEFFTHFNRSVTLKHAVQSYPNLGNTMVFALFPKMQVWFKKMGDIERSYPETQQPTYMYYDDLTRVFLVARDSRVFDAMKKFIHIDYYAWIDETGKAWDVLHEEFLALLDNPAAAAASGLALTGSRYWKDAVPAFFPTSWESMVKQMYPFSSVNAVS